jgi:hypothetical protein
MAFGTDYIVLTQSRSQSMPVRGSCHNLTREQAYSGNEIGVDHAHPNNTFCNFCVDWSWSIIHSSTDHDQLSIQCHVERCFELIYFVPYVKQNIKRSADLTI